MSPTSPRPDLVRPTGSAGGRRARLRDWLHVHLVDHGLLRIRWTNLAEVAPGVWRSNHPTEARFRALRARGIRTILNLRGESGSPPYRAERAACEALGLRLVSVKLGARRAPRRQELLALLDAFRTAERPVLMHCKSGADRAGLASALYLLWIGRPVEEARRQLSWRFLHVRHSRTGALDGMLDLYAARLARGPIGIEDWARDEYDPAAVPTGWRWRP